MVSAWREQLSARPAEPFAADTERARQGTGVDPSQIGRRSVGARPRSAADGTRTRRRGDRVTAFGTNLPIRNVRFHGESWRVSGRATEIAETTFMTHCGHKQGRNTAAQQVSCRTELCYPFSGKTRGACSACPDPGNSGLAERLARAEDRVIYDGLRPMSLLRWRRATSQGISRVRNMLWGRMSWLMMKACADAMS